MSRKKNITIAVACCLVLVGIGVPLLAVLHSPWGHSQWPQVPPGELYVATQPKLQDVAGIYRLTRQTITANGLAVLEGRPCQLDLRADGSFTVTNYPRWSPRSEAAPHVVEFISTTGRWRCDQIGIIHDGHDCWGVRFSGGQAGIDAKIDPLALRGKGAPYDLMFTYGDGDEGMVMTFEKSK